MKNSRSCTAAQLAVCTYHMRVYMCYSFSASGKDSKGLEGFPSVVAVVPAEHPLVCDTHPPSTYLLFDRRFGKAIAGGVKKISSPPRPWKRLAVSPDPEIGIWDKTCHAYRHEGPRAFSYKEPCEYTNLSVTRFAHLE